MALEVFDLATLSAMDGGRIREAFDQALRRLTEDCKDRPAVESARTLSLTVSLVPLPNDEGDLDSVDVSFALKEGIPKRASRTYNMAPARNGLLFNELSPDEVKQKTLDMAPPRPSVGRPSSKEAADVG